MDYKFSVFQQDLGAALKALEAEDFENLNIFANRLMSNAILGENRRLALPGLFLKDVSILVGSLKVRTSATTLSIAMAVTKSYGRKLTKQTTNIDFSEDDLWKGFLEFTSDIRKFTLTQEEEKAYKDDIDFARSATKWFSRFLADHKEELLHQKNQLLKGVLNETNRIYRCHGEQLPEIYATALITSLDRCNDYIKLISLSKDDFEQRVRKDVLPHVDEIVTILSEDTPNSERVNQVLWSLVRKWREFYIEFMEVRRVTVEPVFEPEKGIELPEETKVKLTKAITESLEKETGKKSK